MATSRPSREIHPDTSLENGSAQADQPANSLEAASAVGFGTAGNRLQRAVQNPRAARPETLLQLQRLYGNRAVTNLVQRTAKPALNKHSSSLPTPQTSLTNALAKSPQSPTTIQRKAGFEFEMADIVTQRKGWQAWHPHPKASILSNEAGYQITSDEEDDGSSHIEIIIKEIDETNVAARANLLNVVVPDIIQKLHDICVASWATGQQDWVLGSAVPGLNDGSKWDRLRSITNDENNITGQLQMTGGISMANLPDIVAGRKADQLQIGGHLQTATAFPYMNQMGAGAVFGLADGIVLANPTVILAALPVAEREQLSAVVSMLATIPLNARTQNMPYPKSAAGSILARSDFAAITAQLPAAVKQILTGPLFETLVVDTVNQGLAAAGRHQIQPHHQVLPIHAKLGHNTPKMNVLTISNWIQSLLPTPGFLGANPGRDMLTKKNLPGNAAQKAAVESMGGFGQKLDPGNKPIFEFRSLSGVNVADLADAIRDCIRLLS